jgi:hypothetical protein
MQNPIRKIPTTKKTGGVAQVVEHLPSNQTMRKGTIFLDGDNINQRKKNVKQVNHKKLPLKKQFHFQEELSEIRTLKHKQKFFYYIYLKM